MSSMVPYAYREHPSSAVHLPASSGRSGWAQLVFSMAGAVDGPSADTPAPVPLLAMGVVSGELIAWMLLGIVVLVGTGLVWLFSERA
jgi:hypothetical protein